LLHISWLNGRAGGLNREPTLMAALHPITLITGASAGIGAALAWKFAANGHDLVLVARREEQLAALADEIAATGRTKPVIVPIDLTRVDAPIRLSHELSSRGLEPQIVINTAGFGLVGFAAELDRGEQVSMIDLNVRTLTDLSLRFVDSLERHKGGLLNVGSLAGFLPGPGMAVYYATKAYVLSFSEALHRELAPRGIKVSVLCPGPVPTEFQARAGMGSVSARSLLGCTPEEIADAGYDGFMAGKSIILPDMANKAVPFVLRFLPRSLIVAMSDVTSKRKGAPGEPGWPRRRGS
jgi:short-subunit dehydrogenase